MTFRAYTLGRRKDDACDVEGLSDYQMMVLQPPFDVLASTETGRPRAQSIDGFVSRMFQTCLFYAEWPIYNSRRFHLSITYQVLTPEAVLCIARHGTSSATAENSTHPFFFFNVCNEGVR